MKKSLLALGAACIALSSVAAAPKQKLQTPATPTFNKSADIKPLGKLQVAKANSSMKKAPAKIGAEDLITSVEGTKQDVTITGSGYYLYWGQLSFYENTEAPSHIVYGENNEVYIYDLIPNFGCDSYIKGVKDGDKIVINFPQTVFWDEDYEDGYSMTLFDYHEYVNENGEEKAGYFPVEDASLTISISEDGSMVAEGISEDRIVGGGLISEGDAWIGYGAWELSIAPFEATIVELPEGYEVTKGVWCAKANGYGWPVNFAQGVTEIYIQGLEEAMPEAWIKATLEYEDYTANVYIAQDQYIGDAYGYHIFTKCAKIIVDEDGYIEYELMPSDYQYQLVWDFDAETMVSKDKDVVLLTNASLSEVYYLGDFMDLAFVVQDSFEGTPANPTDLFFDYSMDYYGFDAFLFNVPGLSTDGDILKTEDLYYVVYVDGEEWECDAEDYGLEESLVEIPWSFDDEYIYNWGGIAREVDFFVEGISTIGVQSIYKYGGEETRSEIVTLNLDDPTAVAGLNADKKVASVKLFDVAGREVSSAAKGIVIKRVVYEDGSVASFKNAVR